MSPGHLSPLLRVLDTFIMHEPSPHTGRSLLTSGLVIAGAAALGFIAHALGW